MEMEGPAQSFVDEIIICENVHKWFAEFEALRGMNLRVKTGEVIVIIGPSGSGKSTFIRCLNRLEEHQEGRIIVDGMTMRRACGRMMKRIFCKVLKPNASVASYCPTGMACKPPRIVSAI